MAKFQPVTQPPSWGNLRPGVPSGTAFPGVTINGLGAISITPEVRASLDEFGHAGERFNWLTWPLGADNFARGRFLVYETTLATIQATPPGPVVLQFYDIEFDRMYIRNPVPVFVSEGSGAVYAVELVDERFYWQFNDATGAARNLSTDDKTILYDLTEWDDDQLPGTPPVPWTVEAAVTEVYTSIGGDPAELILPSVSPLDDDEWRDLTVASLGGTAIIDKLAKSNGSVFVAYPNLTYSGSPDKRYSMERVGDGETAAGIVLDAYTDDLLSGGIYSPTDAFTAPSTGAGTVAFGPSEWLRVEVPEAISVAFPISAAQTTQYVTGDEEGTGPGVHYATDRFYNVTSSNGIPGTGNGQTLGVFDTKWAIRTSSDVDPINLTDLQTRADEVANRYYDRYRSGSGHLMLRGIQPIIPYAGTQTVTWSIESIGPITRLDGEFDTPLFGFRSDTALTATDISTSGRVRGIPRPDGGMLFNVIPETIRIYYGKVTQTYDPINSNYDAVAYDDASINVVDQAPVRSDNINLINMPSVPMDTPCWLGVQPDSTIDLYMPWEQRPVTACPDQNIAVQTSEDLFLLARNGRLPVGTL